MKSMFSKKELKYISSKLWLREQELGEELIEIEKREDMDHKYKEYYIRMIDANFFKNKSWKNRVVGELNKVEKIQRKIETELGRK